MSTEGIPDKSDRIRRIIVQILSIIAMTVFAIETHYSELAYFSIALILVNIQDTYDDIKEIKRWL